MCIIVGEDTDRIISDDSTRGLRILSSYGTTQLGDSSYFLYETLFQTLKKKHTLSKPMFYPVFDLWVCWKIGYAKIQWFIMFPVKISVFLPINRTIWRHLGDTSVSDTPTLSFPMWSAFLCHRRILRARAATGQRLWDLVKSAAVPARLLKPVRRQWMAGQVSELPGLVNIQQKLMGKSPFSMGKLPIINGHVQ